MTTRRDFLKLTAAAGAAAVLPVGTVIAKNAEPKKVEVINRVVYYGRACLSLTPRRLEHMVLPQTPEEPLDHPMMLIPQIRMKDDNIDNLEWLFDGIPWELENDPSYPSYPPAARFNRAEYEALSYEALSAFGWLEEKDAVTIFKGDIHHWGVVQVGMFANYQGNVDREPMILPVSNSNHWWYEA